MGTKVLYLMAGIRLQSARHLPPGTYLANVVSVDAGYGCVNLTVNVETFPMVNGGPREALWQRADEYHKEMEAAKALAKELQAQLLKERQERKEAVTNRVLGSGPLKDYNVTMNFTDGAAIRTVKADDRIKALTLAIQDARMLETGPQFSGDLLDAVCKLVK